MWPRRIFVVCSVLSLLLCIATAGLWVRSYWRPGWIRFTSAPWQFCAASYPGRVSFNVYHEVASPDQFPDGSGEVPLTQYPLFGTWSQSNPVGMKKSIHEYYLPQGVRMHRALGCIVINHVNKDSPNSDWSLMTPHAYVILLAAILPIRLIVVVRGSWLRNKRKRLGLCERCGYDLRATPERCPECGTTAKETP